MRVFIDPKALREVVPPPPPGSEVAVTVTCHAACLKWLRGCLESIDAQDPERRGGPRTRNSLRVERLRSRHSMDPQDIARTPAGPACS